MNRSDVIFRDIDTALHVSYIVGAQPARTPCSMRQALIAMIQSANLTNARQRDWYARLVETSSSSRVDFSGLSDLERHAQCALVRQAVIDRLDEPHACVILARYSRTQAEKDAGVSRLTTHLCGRVSATGEAVVIAALLTRRFTEPRYRNGHSLRDLSRRLRVSKSHLSRLAQEIDRECTVLEAEAMAALEARFVSRGVVYSVPILRLTDE